MILCMSSNCRFAWPFPSDGSPPAVVNANNAARQVGMMSFPVMAKALGAQASGTACSKLQMVVQQCDCCSAHDDRVFTEQVRCGHLHLSVTDGDGVAFGGHLVDGCVVDTSAEVVLADLAG